MKLNLFDKLWLGFILIYSVCPISNSIFKEFATANSQNNPNKEKTAILISYENLKEEIALNYLNGVGLTAYYFSKKGKIEIIDKAKKKDLERVLKDSTYKNIAIYGHGATGYWDDSDGERIKYEELNASQKERVLQFTCGGGNQKSLVEMCAKNKEESFYPIRRRIGYQNYFYGLKLLLSQK